MPIPIVKIVQPYRGRIVTCLLHIICMREPGKIEMVLTHVTENYTHGEVKNVIAHLRLTNILKAIKSNPIRIRVMY